MDYNIDDLKKYYENLPDYKVVHIATSEADGLRPEALDILKDEIKKRNLDLGLINAVDIQNETISEQELENYIQLVRDAPCPVCGSSTQPLNATLTGEVISIIIFTNYRKALFVACPSCLKKAQLTIAIKSFFLGWWGFPMGFIRTPQSFYFNYKMYKQGQKPEASEALNAFVLKNTGKIEANRNNISGMQSFLKHVNKGI